MFIYSVHSFPHLKRTTVGTWWVFKFFNVWRFDAFFYELNDLSEKQTAQKEQRRVNGVEEDLRSPRTYDGKGNKPQWHWCWCTTAEFSQWRRDDFTFMHVHVSLLECSSFTVRKKNALQYIFILNNASLRYCSYSSVVWFWSFSLCTTPYSQRTAS